MRFSPIFFLPLVFFFFNQHTDPIQQIIAGIQQWHDNYPQEKVFIQTDRDRYLAGESIWIKSWCTIDNKPTYLSKILYLELVNENGAVIQKKMYQLDSASATSGLIDIPKDVKNGNYSLNAYTLWMLNYPQFICRKSLYIYNKDYREFKKTKEEQKDQLIFLPEGGNMIEGVNSRVAFKAVNKYGLPLEVSGSIFSDNGEKVLDFQSQHDGMGIFEFEPQPGKIYRAKIVFDDGIHAEVSYPQVQRQGVILQVQNTSPSRIFLLIKRGDLHKEKYNNLFIIAQMNGTPVFKASFNIDAGEVGASILKRNLPAGIMQITLFDSSGNPLAERLCFVENHKIVEPQLSLQKLNTTKRGQNLFSFRLDSLIKPDISVLVSNNELTAETQKDNIASSLLLTSDLKGYIHNAGYYLKAKDSTTLKHLDLLLMTQGWRRFSWRQILGMEEISLKYPIETSMNIKGRMTKSDRSASIINGYVTLVIKAEDSTTILSKATLTDKGEFMIDSIFFKNKADIFYQGTDNKKALLPVDIRFYPAYADTLKNSSYKPLVDLNITADKKDIAPLDNYFLQLLSNLDTAGYKMLENVTVRAKKLSYADSMQKEYVSPMFENSDQTLIIPERNSYVNVWQFLNANVPGLNVNPFQAGGVTNVAFARYAGINLDDSDSRYIKFLLNEIPVSTETIDALSPDDVALIKVYKGATAFAFSADAGAISIYTKKGGSSANRPFDKNFQKMEKIGFSYTREFYSPNYTTYPDINKNQKDNRITLYWKPVIKPAKTGDYIIDFHNDDIATAFKVVIQGIDKDGKLVYTEQIVAKQK